MTRAIFLMMVLAGAARAETYVGSVTLRRDADNATSSFPVQDMGGIYVVPSADQFCGAGPCYVTTWKNAGGISVYQSTAAQQPRLSDFMINLPSLLALTRWNNR